MSKKSVITLFEKSLSSPKSIPFRVEAPIISPYKFLIMNLLYNVLFRECHRITSRRLYFGVCILLPLFCLFFMATIFGNGQMENIPIGIVDQDNTAVKQVLKNDKIIVDLHADQLLETTAGMSSGNILDYQLDVFRRVLDRYKTNKGQKIIFIHGKGEGVLRQAIIHELNYKYKHFQYQDASFQEYGYGATQVTIR